MAGEAPERVVLDLDATDDPLHGRQEGRFFHGYYRQYCYLPLYIFCGEHLLCANYQRQANGDAAAGSVEELERIVEAIRERWPEVPILVRADSGFCREEIMGWCEANGVDYLLGLAKNARLKAAIAEELAEAKRLYEESGKASRCHRSLENRPVDGVVAGHIRPFLSTVCKPCSSRPGFAGDSSCR